jgi:hypothetical protein
MRPNFHLDGTVKKQNVRSWAREHPHNFRESSSHARKVTVWVAISSHGLIGPIFFNETVNSQLYLHTLQNEFLPKLMATQLTIRKQWFMQDGSTPHTANAVLDFSEHHFRPSRHVAPFSTTSQLRTFLASTWPRLEPL